MCRLLSILLYASDITANLTGIITNLQEQVVGLQQSLYSMQRLPSTSSSTSESVIDQFYPTFDNVNEFTYFCDTFKTSKEVKDKLVRCYSLLFSSSIILIIFFIEDLTLDCQLRWHQCRRGGADVFRRIGTNSLLVQFNKNEKQNKKELPPIIYNCLLRKLKECFADQTFTGLLQMSPANFSQERRL